MNLTLLLSHDLFFFSARTSTKGLVAKSYIKSHLLLFSQMIVLNDSLYLLIWQHGK